VSARRTAAAPPRAARRPTLLQLVLGQVRYQSIVLLRSPGSPFFALVVPLMVLAALNFLQGEQVLPSRGGIRFPQFFTPAMVAFAVMNACYVTTVTVTVIARDEGILKRLRGTPLPPLAYIAGRAGASSLLAIVSAVLVLLLGHFGYGVDIMPHALPALVVTVTLGMVCFALVGLAVTVLVPNTDVALPVAYGTLLPLCFVSDVFFPADAAQGWLSTAASAFPVKHLAVALERTLNSTVAGTGWDAGDLGLLAAWTVASLLVTLVFFRWESRAAGEPRLRAVRSLLRRATP
jgi:ABC-2 type transport system permease protein